MLEFTRGEELEEPWARQILYPGIHPGGKEDVLRYPSALGTAGPLIIDRTLLFFPIFSRQNRYCCFCKPLSRIFFKKTSFLITGFFRKNPLYRKGIKTR